MRQGPSAAALMDTNAEFRALRRKPATTASWRDLATTGPLVAVLCTRLVCAAVAMLTTYAFVVTQPLWLRDPLHAEALRGLAKRLFEPWAHWDGVWFVRIASGGYRAHPAGAAFFPLYPLLVRGLMPLAFHNYVVAGVCVSLSCYAAAMLVLDRLVEQEAGSQIARGTVLLISVFPMAFFFQAVYSESLFLLLSLLSFWAGRRGQQPRKHRNHRVDWS